MQASSTSQYCCYMRQTKGPYMHVHTCVRNSAGAARFGCGINHLLSAIITGRRCRIQLLLADLRTQLPPLSAHETAVQLRFVSVHCWTPKLQACVCMLWGKEACRESMSLQGALRSGAGVRNGPLALKVLTGRLSVDVRLTAPASERPEVTGPSMELRLHVARLRVEVAGRPSTLMEFREVAASSATFPPPATIASFSASTSSDITPAGCFMSARNSS